MLICIGTDLFTRLPPLSLPSLFRMLEISRKFPGEPLHVILQRVWPYQILLRRKNGEIDREYDAINSIVQKSLGADQQTTTKYILAPRHSGNKVSFPKFFREFSVADVRKMSFLRDSREHDVEVPLGRGPRQEAGGFVQLEEHVVMMSEMMQDHSVKADFCIIGKLFVLFC